MTVFHKYTEEVEKVLNDEGNINECRELNYQVEVRAVAKSRELIEVELPYIKKCRPKPCNIQS